MKLKPCPFCAGKAYVIRNGGDRHSVACQDCYVETSNEKGKLAAMKVWNSRVK